MPIDAPYLEVVVAVVYYEVLLHFKLRVEVWGTTEGAATRNYLWVGATRYGLIVRMKFL